MIPVNELQKIIHGVKHGESTLLEHCIDVYNILKEIDLEEYVCNAGLYHSVYSTEYFQHDTTISRETIKNIIGDQAEHLVYEFCTIKDRDNAILNNTPGYDQKTHYDLLCLSYANLSTQKQRQGAVDLLEKFSNAIEKIENKKTDKLNSDNFIVDGKHVYVFDNKLSYHYQDKLFDFCRKSKYIPDHGSSELRLKNDSRFVSYLNESDLENIDYKEILNAILPITIKKIHSAYINSYNIGSFNNPHTDESKENYYTIIVYPNTEWNNLWGGETKFYSKQNIENYVVDYVPGRIIVFDSRIQHHSLTVNYSAEIARYSIVMKCEKDD